MKKKSIIALALALSATALAACGNVNQKLSFNANWQQQILNESQTASTEELTYEVKFEKASFLQKDYFTVEYCGKNNDTPGSYTTKLEYLPEGDAYRYSTELKMDVKFTLADGQFTAAQDVVTTETIFKKASKDLQPISSTKNVVCHSPNNVAAITLDGTYKRYDYQFQIDYNYDGDTLSGGKLTQTDRAGTLLDKEAYPDGIRTQEFGIDLKKYTYLDNEQILFAIRGLSSSTLAGAKKLNTYNASLGVVEINSLTPSTAAKTDFTFSLNGGEAKAHEIDYVPMTLKSENKNNKITQSLWYAKSGEANNNVYRNALLKMVVTMHYGLGMLTYTLKDAKFSH